MLPSDLAAADVSAGGVASTGPIRALVADPVESTIGGWRVGEMISPSAPDPVAARAARLEARLAVYAQYAAVVAEAAAAAVAGDGARRDALTSERDATAEHFAELRSATEYDERGTVDFSVALTDALHELRHQDAVDNVLGRRLRALRDAAATRDATPSATREPLAAITAGGPAAPRLDVRF